MFEVILINGERAFIEELRGSKFYEIPIPGWGVERFELRMEVDGNRIIKYLISHGLVDED